MGMITKDYVTLAFVLSIDNMFSGILTENIKNNVNLVNSTGILKMGKDFNSLARIKKRMLTSWENETWTFSQFSSEFGNMFVNIIYTVLTNFEVIFYNYFAPMTCIII